MEWTVADWGPMLLDILTVALFVGGCLLLWLNFRPRGGDVLRNLETADQRIEEETAHPGLDARHLQKSTSQQPSEATTAYAAPAAPSERYVGAEMPDLADPNSYANRVVLAMKALRNEK